MSEDGGHRGHKLGIRIRRWLHIPRRQRCESEALLEGGGRGQLYYTNPYYTMVGVTTPPELYFTNLRSDVGCTIRGHLSHEPRWCQFLMLCVSFVESGLHLSKPNASARRYMYLDILLNVCSRSEKSSLTSPLGRCSTGKLNYHDRHPFFRFLPVTIIRSLPLLHRSLHLPCPPFCLDTFRPVRLWTAVPCGTCRRPHPETWMVFQCYFAALAALKQQAGARGGKETSAKDVEARLTTKLKDAMSRAEDIKGVVKVRAWNGRHVFFSEYLQKHGVRQKQQRQGSSLCVNRETSDVTDKCRHPCLRQYLSVQTEKLVPTPRMQLAHPQISYPFRIKSVGRRTHWFGSIMDKRFDECLGTVFSVMPAQEVQSIRRALSTSASIGVFDEISYGLLQLSRRCCDDACLG